MYLFYSNNIETVVIIHEIHDIKALLAKQISKSIWGVF